MTGLPKKNEYRATPLPEDADDVSVLRRAAEIFRERGPGDEPSGLVPVRLENLAMRIADERRTLSPEEVEANRDYDDARAFRASFST